MPGIRSVRWDDGNRAKVLDALTALEYIKVNAATTQKIAAYVGNGCTAKAVDTLLVSLGRRKKDEIVKKIAENAPGLSESGDTVPAKVKANRPQTVLTGRISKAGKNASSNAKNVKKTVARVIELSDKLPATPPESADDLTDAKVKVEPTQPWVSPRQNRKRPNYKTMAGLDSDGEELDNASEDSKPSDAEYDTNNYLADDDDGDDFFKH